ncbi:MAG: HAMP domain-containing protein [Candidatus Eremiobacteraeota bacterium]|nr:HAMP domain-containing protein [Candidatus Eremiobacteraeota bacterium]
MSLRTRLAWMYGIAVFVAAGILAIVSLTSIDRSLRSSLDARLNTASAAATAITDVHHGKLELDAEDREQLLDAMAGVMEIAVFTNDGRLYMSSVPAVPPAITQLATSQSPNGNYSVRSGNTDVRVAISSVQRDGVTYGIVAVWQGSGFIDEFDRFAIIAMTLAALGVGGIVVILSSTLARRALAPLERFTTLATEIEAHDLSRRVGAQGADELGRLGSAFDRMLDRLEGAFGRQRRFTADASHELRAPLAVIRAEADVALAKDRTSDEYRAALHTIVNEVDRIDALVDALLVAARADSSRMVFEPVDIGEITALTVQRFQPAAAARNVTIETSVTGAFVNGDAQALERAIAAVVHNALDFAHAHVMLRVATNEAGGAVDVCVEDDGPGFTQEGLSHATERFWRADPARRRGGTGLGLSIADAIVRAHGGRLVLSNVAPHGARVTLEFPFIGASSRDSTMEE